jgi:hypothetical protein
MHGGISLFEGVSVVSETESGICPWNDTRFFSGSLTAELDSVGIIKNFVQRRKLKNFYE